MNKPPPIYFTFDQCLRMAEHGFSLKSSRTNHEYFIYNGVLYCRQGYAAAKTTPELVEAFEIGTKWGIMYHPPTDASGFPRFHKN